MWEKRTLSASQGRRLSLSQLRKVRERKSEAEVVCGTLAISRVCLRANQVVAARDAAVCLLMPQVSTSLGISRYRTNYGLRLPTSMREHDVRSPSLATLQLLGGSQWTVFEFQIMRFVSLFHSTVVISPCIWMQRLHVLKRPAFLDMSEGCQRTKSKESEA